MTNPSRSRERITISDLIRLEEIARGDRERMFRTDRNWALYADCLPAVALCQGAALHYVDGRNGIKDFDVWTFFARATGRPFPDLALYRRNKPADFGPSRFGRTLTAPAWFHGRRVDLLSRSLDVPADADRAEAISNWVAAGGTTSARKLAKKPIVLIAPMPGHVIWPVAHVE